MSNVDNFLDRIPDEISDFVHKRLEEYEDQIESILKKISAHEYGLNQSRNEIIVLRSKSMRLKKFLKCSVVYTPSSPPPIPNARNRVKEK